MAPNPTAWLTMLTVFCGVFSDLSFVKPPRALFLFDGAVDDRRTCRGEIYAWRAHQLVGA